MAWYISESTSGVDGNQRSLALSGGNEADLTVGNVFKLNWPLRNFKIAPMGGWFWVYST